MRFFYTANRFCQLVMVILLCQLAPGAMAQETNGSLQGKVKTSDGHPLGGASLVATHLSSGTVYRSISLADGRYIIPNLRIGGPYLVEISFTGMGRQSREGITISLGEPVILNFILKDSAQELSGVVVKAAKSAPRVNIYGAGENISQRQLQQTPTINRSLTDITRQVPQGSKDNSFLGSSFRYNNVTIDGAINNDAIGFSPSAGGVTGSSGMPGSSTRTNPVSLDAIEDIQVYLAPYDVKIGNFTGGSINAVTRSGTNTVHGSVYAYGRNASITGKDNAGDGRKMPSWFREYQTGFRLGLPIIRNKLFFFTNLETTELQDPVLQEAGTAASAGVLSLKDAQLIHDHTVQKYGFDPGTYGQYNAWSRSDKLFNRIDWNIDGRHQLAIRNNTVFSRSINMERDQADFRFGSIAYKQTNNQQSTVAELKSRFTNRVSNIAILSYATIHDCRTPLSDPSFPQVQIVGRTPGSTIFLGTDREASIFNMRQNSIEITDNMTFNLGKHTLLAGTHNELYNITYGFVNAWNGRVDYANVEDYLNNNPTRVRGSYNYLNNSRDYILSHPDAKFRINFYSLYIQDENHISDRFRLTYGLRVDYVDVPHKQILSDKTINAQTDPYIGTTYDYTPLSQITGHYLSRPSLSPRVGFNVDVLGDKRLVLRGGAGLFSGRIPFAWLGYAFYNNGNSFGSYDQRTDGSSPQPFAEGTDPLKYGAGGIADFAAKNGQVVKSASAGKTQVDVIDNRFVMPKALRASLAVDYTDAAGYKYSLEGIYTKTIKDVQFQQVNLTDQPTYFAYDSALRRQPIFASGSADGRFANAYEMGNTSKGYRYSITGRISRNFPNGITASAAYTYGASKDISNGIRNSMESNWQLNQALNPNSPQLAWSNFDIRHRIIASLGYKLSWKNGWSSDFSLFFNAQSGAPYTYGFLNYTIQNTPQQVSLAYIPKYGESINFFQSYTDPATGNQITAQQQAAAFDHFIDGDKYLSGRRGDFTERNAAHTPWNVQADFHFEQNFVLSFAKSKQPHVVTLTWNIMNLTNLLNSNWGWVYFSPNTYNSTSSVGLIPYIPVKAYQGYPIFKFTDPGKPYSVDFFSSRWQMQVGLRYSF